MNLLQDIITYIRRIVKSPSNAQLTDNLIIDYINRFWLMDVDARVQLFDLKTSYRFQTSPGRDRYNMPLYDVQTEPGNQTIASFPVYQGFSMPAYVNGIQMPFYTEQNSFWNLWPNYVQSLAPAATGDGGSTYSLSLPFFPALPGYIDIAGISAIGTNQDPPVTSSFITTVPVTSVYPAVFITSVDSTGATVVVSDSGQFLNGNENYGLLMRPGKPPLGNVALNGGYSTTKNTVNYTTGAVNVTFTSAAGGLVNIPSGTDINVQCYFFQQGLPRAILFYNNCLLLRPPPDISYLVELSAYLTPAAFLSTGSAVPFGYMSEYIARGAARKIMADTGDIEQFQFYEPLFREQETLVWKRSQRQFTSTRTGTIFSDLQGQSNYNNIGQGST